MDRFRTSQESTLHLTDPDLGVNLVDTTAITALYSAAVMCADTAATSTTLRPHRALEPCLLTHNRRTRHGVGLCSSDMRTTSHLRDQGRLNADGSATQ